MDHSKRIAALDGVRSLAIIMAVVVHMVHMQTWGFRGWPENLHTVLGFCWAGVELFFALSGFLVGGSIIRQAVAGEFSFGRFYMDRTLRIFPIAWAFIVYWGVHFDKFGLNTWTWSNLLYVSNYVGSGAPTHFWSLQVEECFYMSSPFLLLGIVDGLRRIKRVPLEDLLMGVLILGLYGAWVLRWYLLVSPQEDHETSTNIWPLTYVDYFIGGMLISMFHDRGITGRVVGKVRNLFGQYQWVPSVVVVAAMVPVALMTADCNQPDSTRTGVNYAAALPLIWAWSTAMVFWFAGSSQREDEKHDAVVAVFSGQRAHTLAVLSYSIYVWHFALVGPLTVAQPFRTDLAGMEHLLGAVVLQIIVDVVGFGCAAYLSYHCLELPFLRLREKLRNRMKTAKQVALAA
jgi:peptidoglycan/LPS O-acetylase OafA/YrhL